MYHIYLCYQVNRKGLSDELELIESKLRCRRDVREKKVGDHSDLMFSMQLTFKVLSWQSSCC